MIVHDKVAHDKFREIFWDAFHRPDLKSEKFENTLIELQPLNDLLAGPLFSIYENGQCDYMFKDKVRFPQVKHEDDFLNWYIDVINQYKDLISSKTADTDIEEKDKQILLYQTDMMMELAGLAYEIIGKSR
ncbi:MAG TPA: hypothetical protein VNW99_03170 [Cytophagaceae bacterium]|jgi:hypothetical protein|nr:hypothetical protein [Cytophagaceae bacterium]